MRRLLKGLGFLLLAVALALGLLLLLASSSQALVERSEAISPDAVAQARRLLTSHDPRRYRTGQLISVVLPAALLDEGVNYLAGRYPGARGQLRLVDGAAEIAISIPVAGQRFFNLHAVVRPQAGIPRLDSLRLGRLPLPATLAESLLAGFVRAYGFDRQWQLAANAIQDVGIDPARGAVRVIYLWEPGLLDQARAVALSDAHVAHLQAAHTALAGLLAHRAPGSPVTVSELLQGTLPVSGDDLLPRGRAALLVLASLLDSKDLAAIVPAARQWPRIRPVRVTLAGRHDLAQHFVISAALAAWSGEPISDAIGLYKELDDARHGGGFSFIDLAADRAGTRFGETMMTNPGRLASVLHGSLSDADLLPPVADLPEYLRADEFKRRFAHHDSPQFQAMAREIDRRIASLALYHR